MSISILYTGDRQFASGTLWSDVVSDFSASVYSVPGDEESGCV